MAVASYTTDLRTITEAESILNFTAIGGGAAGLGVETQYFLQNAACVSKDGWNVTTPRGFVYDSAAAFNVESGSAVFIWSYWQAPNALATKALGGFQFLLGSSATAFNAYYVKGNDTYTYGGWFNLPIDPIAATADATVGTPGASSTWDSVGVRTAQNGLVTKGSPLAMDVARHGRRLFVTNGDSSAYGTFLSASIVNDGLNNRYGLFQAIDGGYLQQGIFSIGSGSTSCDFRDTGRNISINNTEYTSPSFNRFEITGSGTYVDWTRINISALGTNAPGDFFATTRNITGSFDRCSFSQMGYFQLTENLTFDSCVWTNANTITQNTASFIGCTFIESKNISASLLSNNPSKISSCGFVGNGTKHAIELTTPGTYTFSGNTFVGFGTTGTFSASLYNNSGGAVTMSITGNGDVATYRNGAGASTLIVANTAVTLTGMKDFTEVRIFDAGTTNELAGIEDVTDGTVDDREFTFSLQAATVVDIVIHSVQYVSQRINNYEVPGLDSDLPIQQQFDRNYLT